VRISFPRVPLAQYWIARIWASPSSSDLRSLSPHLTFLFRSNFLSLWFPASFPKAFLLMSFWAVMEAFFSIRSLPRNLGCFFLTCPAFPNFCKVPSGSRMSRAFVNERGPPCRSKRRGPHSPGSICAGFFFPAFFEPSVLSQYPLPQFRSTFYCESCLPTSSLNGTWSPFFPLLFLLSGTSSMWFTGPFPQYYQMCPRK